MSATIPQKTELIKNLMRLLQAYRGVFKQERVYVQVVALVLAEVMAFGRHTITQLLMVLGLNEEDWSAGRFKEGVAAQVMVAETLKHVGVDEVYVVGGDGMQTPRPSRCARSMPPDSDPTSNL